MIILFHKNKNKCFSFLVVYMSSYCNLSSLDTENNKNNVHSFEFKELRQEKLLNLNKPFIIGFSHRNRNKWFSFLAFYMSSYCNLSSLDTEYYTKASSQF